MSLENVKESKFVSAVIYLRNDAAYVDHFLEMITRTLGERFIRYELIFVNDASEDGGVAAIYDFFEKHRMDSQMVSIIQMSHYQGQESAMNAGRDLAIGDFVYEFDDMFIDYPEDLVFQVYQKTLEGLDVVSAGCENGTEATSRIFYHLYNRFSGSRTGIGSETFRVLSRRAINRIKSIGQYIPYRKAVYMNCGLNVGSISYRSDRADSRRKALSQRHERFALALDSLVYFTDVMETLSRWICFGFIVFAVFIIIDIIYESLAGMSPVEGWRSTMGFLSIGFVGVFLLLSIILKYLSVLLNLTYRKQRYLIAGVEKIAPQQGAR